jgi:hypothetical protein
LINECKAGEMALHFFYVCFTFNREGMVSEIFSMEYWLVKLTLARNNKVTTCFIIPNGITNNPHRDYKISKPTLLYLA